jgi:hypothetical protein
LFCSGAAMLVHRGTFLDLGGFAEDYFAYYEDVDLGWRLHLAGHDVRHVPAAVVRHRGGGSAHRLPGGERARLLERNALATVARCYGDAVLARVLPAALALAAHRAGAPIEVIDSADPAPGARLPVPAGEWPGWPALAPLRLDLAALARQRAAVQATRRRDDADIFPLLVAPIVPVPPSGASRIALERAVARFGLADIFPRASARGRSAAGGSGMRLQRALAVLVSGGPRALGEEVRTYRSWRRGGGR